VNEFPAVGWGRVGGFIDIEYIGGVRNHRRSDLSHPAVPKSHDGGVSKSVVSRYRRAKSTRPDRLAARELCRRAVRAWLSTGSSAGERDFPPPQRSVDYRLLVPVESARGLGSSHSHTAGEVGRIRHQARSRSRCIAG
jgi:hypothetical protein